MEADSEIAMVMPTEMAMATAMAVETMMRLELEMAMAIEMSVLVSALITRHQDDSMWIRMLVGCSKQRKMG